MKKNKYINQTLNDIQIQLEELKYLGTIEKRAIDFLLKASIVIREKTKMEEPYIYNFDQILNYIKNIK